MKLFLIWSAIWLFLGLLISLPHLLGSHDVFLTSVKEGTIKVVMSGGKVVRYLANLKNFSIDEKTGEILPPTGWEPFSLLGYQFMGLNPGAQVHSYKFSYARLKLKDGHNTVEAKKDEVVDELYFRSQYATDVEAVTSDNVKLTLIIQFFMHITNAELALFPKANFLEVMMDHIRAVVRDYVAMRTYDEVMQDQSAGVFTDLITRLMELNTAGPDGNPAGALTTLVGSEIESATVVEVEVEANDKLRAALQKGRIAKEEAEAIKTIAEAEKKRVADVYAAAIAAGGKDAATMYEADRLAEAIKANPNLTTLVIGGGRTSINTP